MDILEVMKARHSVRQYQGKKIEDGVREALNAQAGECRRRSGLNIQILFDEPKCFDSMMAHYGKFSGVENYIALVGKKDAALDEKAGYYGEQLVLKAQELGLNTCWVAMTHGKSAAEIRKGEKLACIIALGYGVMQGTVHQNKPLEQLCNCASGMPDWFSRGNGGCTACTYSNEPAEILYHTGKRKSICQGWKRVLYKDGPWHSKISF